MACSMDCDSGLLMESLLVVGKALKLAQSMVAVKDWRWEISSVDEMDF